MATQENSMVSFLTKYARQDVNSAKRNGVHAITQTKKGNIEIQYDYQSGKFQAVNWNDTNIKLSEPMTKNEMIDFVANVYIVE